MIAIIFVLTVFADSGSVLESLPRPLAVGVGVGLTVQLVATALAKSLYRGAAASSLVLLTAITPASPLLVLGVLIIRELYRRRGQAMPSMSIGFFFLLMLFMSAVRTVTSPAFALDDLQRSPDWTAAATPGAGPGIFLLWLDAYPRSDTLASWGEDNTWFEQALFERGFAVAPQSHSNYSQTALVLPTMLHMRHANEIDALVPVPDSLLAQQRAIRESLKTTPVTSFLHARGYHIVSSGLPDNYLTLGAADEYADGGQLTAFEHQVLTRTILDGLVPEFALSARRARVLDALAAARQAAQELRPGPVFSFTHVMSPHTPFVFDREGSTPEMACRDECHPWFVSAADMGLSPYDYESAYANQVRYLNSIVLNTVDAIIESSPEAVVVILSDHGSRGTTAVTDEWFATFFAARTPGHPDLFPQDARPIEVFPRLLDAYFGQEISVPRDVTFHSPRGSRMPLTTVPWP